MRVIHHFKIPNFFKKKVYGECTVLVGWGDEEDYNEAEVNKALEKLPKIA